MTSEYSSRDPHCNAPSELPNPDQYIHVKTLNANENSTVAVYRYEPTGELVTIKILQEHTLQEFLKECTVLQSNLNRSSIVSAYKGSYKIGKLYYIVSEYDEEYNDLSKEASKKQYTEEERRQLCINLFTLVKTLHSMGIAHMDIKLQNILVHTVTKELRFIDFGLSCIHEDELCEPLVTPYMYYPYTIPELEDKRTPPFSFQDKILLDYYSVGICVYQLLSNDYTIIPIADMKRHYITYYQRMVRYFSDTNFIFTHLIGTCTQRIEEIGRMVTTLHGYEFYRIVFPSLASLPSSEETLRLEQARQLEVQQEAQQQLFLTSIQAMSFTSRFPGTDYGINSRYVIENIKKQYGSIIDTIIIPQGSSCIKKNKNKSVDCQDETFLYVHGAYRIGGVFDGHGPTPNGLFAALVAKYYFIYELSSRTETFSSILEMDVFLTSLFDYVHMRIKSELLSLCDGVDTPYGIYYKKEGSYQADYTRPIYGGTTATIVITDLAKRKTVVAYVGDSDVYAVKNKSLLKLTTDLHSVYHLEEVQRFGLTVEGDRVVPVINENTIRAVTQGMEFPVTPVDPREFIRDPSTIGMLQMTRSLGDVESHVFGKVSSIPTILHYNEVFPVVLLGSDGFWEYMHKFSNPSAISTELLLNSVPATAESIIIHMEPVFEEILKTKGTMDDISLVVLTDLNVSQSILSITGKKSKKSKKIKKSLQKRRLSTLFKTFSKNLL